MFNAYSLCRSLPNTDDTNVQHMHSTVIEITEKEEDVKKQQKAHTITWQSLDNNMIKEKECVTRTRYGRVVCQPDRLVM